MIHSIDALLLAIPGFEATIPYERAGLRLSPPTHGRRTLLIGDTNNRVAIHFVLESGVPSALLESHRQALAWNRPHFAIQLRVSDLEPTLATLNAQGFAGERLPDHPDGLTAWLPVQEQAGTDLLLLQSTKSPLDRHALAVADGLIDHELPLIRLDHLAIVVPELEDRCRCWTKHFNIPVAGEVTTPAMVIRQLRLGDAILELLGPNGPGSPIHQRPRGLISMASWEVKDLDAVVAHFREKKFTVSDPAVGVLPGTRIATVQGSELAGMNMQLLQYV